MSLQENSPYSPQEPHYPTGEVVAPPPDNVFKPKQVSRFASIRYAPATYLLLAINIGVFVWMVYKGADPRLPSSPDLIRFGADYPYFMVEMGQWWRLITAMFVHVGLLHLAANMWCLWNLGLLGEPLLGFFGMCSVYLLTGAAGNLLSTTWNILFNRMGEVGAGASGAVFGIAGILIVLLSNRRLAEPRMGRPAIPWIELVKLRKSVIQFAVINFVIGFATVFGGPVRVDNTAHLGGFLCGLAMGVPLLPKMTLGREIYLGRQKVAFAGFAFALALYGWWMAHLR